MLAIMHLCNTAPLRLVTTMLLGTSAEQLPFWRLLLLSQICLFETKAVLHNSMNPMHASDSPRQMRSKIMVQWTHEDCTECLQRECYNMQQTISCIPRQNGSSWHPSHEPSLHGAILHCRPCQSSRKDEPCAFVTLAQATDSISFAWLTAPRSKHA